MVRELWGWEGHLGYDEIVVLGCRTPVSEDQQLVVLHSPDQASHVSVSPLTSYNILASAVLFTILQNIQFSTPTLHPLAVMLRLGLLYLHDRKEIVRLDLA